MASFADIARELHVPHGCQFDFDTFGRNQSMWKMVSVCSNSRVCTVRYFGLPIVTFEEKVHLYDEYGGSIGEDDDDEEEPVSTRITYKFYLQQPYHFCRERAAMKLFPTLRAKLDEGLIKGTFFSCATMMKMYRAVLTDMVRRRNAEYLLRRFVRRWRRERYVRQCADPKLATARSRMMREFTDVV